jgi:hypothetical protein
MGDDRCSGPGNEILNSLLYHYWNEETSEPTSSRLTIMITKLDLTKRHRRRHSGRGGQRLRAIRRKERVIKSTADLCVPETSARLDRARC